GGFPGPRRAVEAARAEPVGHQHPAEQLAGAEEVLLADELVQGPRPHPGGQRLRPPAVGGLHVGEQVHASAPAVNGGIRRLYRGGGSGRKPTDDRPWALTATSSPCPPAAGRRFRPSPAS